MFEDTRLSSIEWKRGKKSADKSRSRFTAGKQTNGNGSSAKNRNEKFAFRAENVRKIHSIIGSENNVRS